MKILTAHNRYMMRGGEDETRESEGRLLRERGHEVRAFLETNERVAKLGPVRSGLRTIWSRESYARLRRILRHTKYDVIDVHNFFPLVSPSVYYAARAEGVPVVQMLHNYRLLCSGATFYRDGRVCEDCLGKAAPWPGILHACYREDRAATSAVAAMITAHRLLGTWTRMVDVYVALTEFARRKFIQGGLPADRIAVKPNFVHPDPGPGSHTGGYALFVGRLSREKGVETLLRAFERLGDAIPLKIVGDGPMAPWVAEAAERVAGVEWLGRKPVGEVYDLMGEARALVFPSEWYETFGRVAVEAFAKGTPAIASDIGAIAELVEHGRTGLLFKPGDADDLAAKIDWALAHPSEMAGMRREARAEFEAKYTAERNYHKLMEIYSQAIARGQSRG